MTTIEDFLKFIDAQQSFLRTTKRTGYTDREFILACTVKIAEEFGELCDEVLASLGDQRTGKMDGRGIDSLSDEFADVIITTFILAKSMGIDVMETLGPKIKKIQEKHNKQLIAQI